MSEESTNMQLNLPFDEGNNNEGPFDNQLTLPLGIPSRDALVQEIIKRDGRREPFDPRKIATAILNATPTPERLDTESAEGIAKAVTLYLARQLNGAPATADQVSDAVERVLIYMAQAETALAYVRYRDRRTRIRRLQKGDMQLVLSEIREAKREQVAITHSTPLVHVQTSSEKIVRWDRNRIVKALQLETGLDAALAELIALEIESQIKAAGITALTAPLVRELVGAKLIEHGLFEEGARRRRLGVPLFDASRIIRRITEETLGATPRETDYELAKAIKKEFALSEVFSPSVSQAHLLGRIHIHNLEFVDRFQSLQIWPETFHRLYGEMFTLNEGQPPKSRSAGFLTEVLHKCQQLLSFFSTPPSFQAFNFSVAPAAEGLNEKEMEDIASRYLREFAAYAHHHRGQTTHISFYWNPPPSRAYTTMSSSNTFLTNYELLQPVARSFSVALIKSLATQGSILYDPDSFHVDIVIEENLFNTLEGNAFLLLAARTALAWPGISFIMKRPSPPGMITSDFVLPCVWQRVSLNLPRAAVRSQEPSAFWAELEALCELAITAHLEKQFFMESLYATSRPTDHLLQLLDVCASNNITFEIAVDGLAEGADIAVGSDKPLIFDRLAFMSNTLGHVRRLVQSESSKYFLSCLLTANDNPKISERFAELDAEIYPAMIGPVIKSDHRTKKMVYSSGISLSREYHKTPYEIAKIEGMLHEFFPSPLFTTLAIPNKNMSDTGLVDLIKKIYFQTECKGIGFETNNYDISI